MKYALTVALLVPLAAGQPGISFSPGFIIEAADSPANPQCPCYPCRCGSTCHCTGEAPCDCRDGSTCFCPCVGCPCDKGKPCICGKDCKCKKCPGKSNEPSTPGDVSYSTLRKAAIAQGRDLVVWVGVKPPWNSMTYMSGGIFQAQESLGWVNPWGETVNQPCRYEFYWEGGRIWLKQTVWVYPARIPMKPAPLINC